MLTTRCLPYCLVPATTGNKRWCCGDALHLDLSYVRSRHRSPLAASRSRHCSEVGMKPAICIFFPPSSRAFPLFQAAFDAIAQRDRGVVDLKVRAADCSKWGQQVRYDSEPS